jgi:thiol-disulfide isomerase/thioredoxin
MMDREENADFEKAIKAKQKAYVLFYASWCHFSQRFLPIFRQYAKTNPDKCMKVMIDFREDLCEKYGIDYYPTVLLFKNGEVKSRLDATPGLGLDKEQLIEFVTSSQG